MRFGPFRYDVAYKLFAYKSSNIMCKQDLSLNTKLGLTCPKKQMKQTNLLG